MLEVLIMELQKDKQNQGGHDEIFRMKEGIGDASYYQNSKFQGTTIKLVRKFLEESVHETVRSNGNQCKTIHIADMGCSSSYNALDASNVIITTTLRALSEDEKPSIPQIFYFFNDLPSNDFNTLFKIISQTDSQLKNSSVFNAVVSGSFHVRVFPAKSLHFVYSSYALHWLSKVPEEVKDEHSIAWNPRNVSYDRKTQPSVTSAYLKQFKSDFSSFLKARGEEIVAMGRLFLILGGMDSEDPQSGGRYEAISKLFNLSFQEMISKGLLSKDIVDTFNIPMFHPSVEEIKEIVNYDGRFEFCRGKFLKNSEYLLQEDAEGRKRMGKVIIKHVQAIFESLVENHFGTTISVRSFEIMNQIVEEIWEDVVNCWGHGGIVFVELVCK